MEGRMEGGRRGVTSYPAIAKRVLKARSRESFLHRVIFRVKSYISKFRKFLKSGWIAPPVASEITY